MYGSSMGTRLPGLEESLAHLQIQLLICLPNMEPIGNKMCSNKTRIANKVKVKTICSLRYPIPLHSLFHSASNSTPITEGKGKVHM